MTEQIGRTDRQSDTFGHFVRMVFNRFILILSISVSVLGALGIVRLCVTAVVRNASAVAVLHNGEGWFDVALWLDPDEPRSRLWRARQLAEVGDWKAAAITLGSPESSDGWLLAAQLAWQRGDRQSAIEAWRHVPDVAYRFIRDAEAASERGDLDTARTAFLVATSVRPESGWVARRLGLFLLGPANDPAGAVPHFERAIAQGEGTNDPYLYVEYAHALQRSGRLADARVVLTSHPIDVALANAILGDAARAAGHFAEAVRLLERAVRQDPSNPWFWHALAAVYAEQGRLAEARRAYLEALRIDPTFEPALGSINSLPPS